MTNDMIKEQFSNKKGDVIFISLLHIFVVIIGDNIFP